MSLFQVCRGRLGFDKTLCKYIFLLFKFKIKIHKGRLIEESDEGGCGFSGLIKTLWVNTSLNLLGGR